MTSLYLTISSETEVSSAGEQLTRVSLMYDESSKNVAAFNFGGSHFFTIQNTHAFKKLNYYLFDQSSMSGHN